MEQETGAMILLAAGALTIGVYGWKAHRTRRQLEPPSEEKQNATDQTQRNWNAEFGTTHPSLEITPDENAWEDQAADSNSMLDLVLCPACKLTFLAGTPYCKACGKETVDLEEGPDPSQILEVSRINAPLVCVFSTLDTLEAKVVHSMLESHGIRVTINGVVPLDLYSFQKIGISKVRLMTLESEADLAKDIIASTHTL